MLLNFYIKDATSGETIPLATAVFHFSDRQDYPVMATGEGLISVNLDSVPSSITISSAGYKTAQLSGSSIVGMDSISIQRNEIELPGVVVRSGKNKSSLLIIAALLLLTQVK